MTTYEYSTGSDSSTIPPQRPEQKAANGHGPGYIVKVALTSAGWPVLILCYFFFLYSLNGYFFKDYIYGDARNSFPGVVLSTILVSGISFALLRATSPGTIAGYLTRLSLVSLPLMTLSLGCTDIIANFVFAGFGGAYAIPTNRPINFLFLCALALPLFFTLLFKAKHAKPAILPLWVKVIKTLLYFLAILFPFGAMTLVIIAFFFNF